MTLTLSKKYLPKSRLRKLAYGVLITLPVIAYIFKFSLLYRHGIFQGEDWDYFAQAYEAARLSILHYHQFPWWNPWTDGGQPLFANPQFGLFSIQMPLVLLFGTVVGLHYSILVYFILGFWGMYCLLRRIGAESKLIAILLSYVWTFSAFSTWHLAGGHYTFTIYLLSPWAFLTVLNIHKKRGWLWFGLVASLLIQTAAHYLTIEALVICALIALVQIIRQLYKEHAKTLKALVPILMPYALAAALILVLCGVRLYYAFQFTHEFPRLEPLDPPESLKLFIASLTFRHPVDPGSLTTVGITHYDWTEYTGYFGLGSVILFCYLLVRRFEKIKSVSFKEWSILIATATVAFISLGASPTSFSFFGFLHHLPLFNQMRVPSRFICWVVLGMILFLVKLPRKPIVYALLIISIVDVFAANYAVINYPEKRYANIPYSSNQFEQYEFYQADPGLGQIGILDIQNLRLLRTTQQNYGEVYGYEPILNIGEYYYAPFPGTTRCGVGQGCPFVISKNAVVTKWSPLNIDLRRTGPGAIQINMNPGKVWFVNGKSIFRTDHILELEKNFIINDPSQNIDITYHPVLH
jgi:hypothetical protein